MAETLEHKLRRLHPELLPYFSIPEIKKALLQGVKENWDAVRFQGAIMGSNWYRTHNEQQRRWQVLPPADREAEIQRSSEQLAAAWSDLYGVDMDPMDLRKYGADRIARGDVSINEWVAQERKSSRFQTRYPGIAAREKAGLPVPTPEQYRAYEEGFRQQLQRYGVDPSKFDDPKDFTSLFANDLQPEELGQRLELWYNVENVYGQHFKQAFASHAGLDLSTQDVYGMLTGQRPDLQQAYANATGTAPPEGPLTLRTLLQSAQQATSEEKALFTSGGSARALRTQGEQAFA